MKITGFLFVVFFCSFSAFAETQSVSLAPILGALGFYEPASEVIEIKTCADILVKPGEKSWKSKRSILAWPTFPIEHFASSNDGNTIAILLSQQLGFTDNNLKNQILLIDVSTDVPELIRKIDLQDGDEWSCLGLTFLGNNILRIERLRSTPGWSPGDPDMLGDTPGKRVFYHAFVMYDPTNQNTQAASIIDGLYETGLSKDDLKTVMLRDPKRDVFRAVAGHKAKKKMSRITESNLIK